MPAVPDSDSSTSNSKYHHVLSLARGGMGEVELAMRKEGDFQRFYAIKRLHPQFRDDASFREMFIDEARLAGLIRHRNVVSVLDVGEDSEGPFQVMDFIEGPSVSKLLRRLGEDGERLPLQLALDIAAQACRGLHAAHELRGPNGEALNLVHRDVSPQNILIGYDGGIRVTDFGVAKAMGRQTKTESGVLKGKMGYMSPEQLRYHEVDRRSDLFSLGVVLFELLSGKRLYGNKTRAAPLAILEDPVPDVGEHHRDLPPELVMLTMELLAKEPEERPGSAKAVAERLEEIAAELRMTHGRVNLSDFVTRMFSEERDAIRSKMKAGAPVLTAGALNVGGGEHEAPPRRAKRRWLVLAAVALVMLGFYSALFLRDESETVHDGDTPEPAAVSTEPPSVEEEQAAASEPVPTVEPPAPPPVKRVRRRRSRGQDHTMRTMSGHEILDWD